MTTAYTSLLGLALPVTGELSGTWGDTVNNSITSLLDSAIAGTTTISSDADVTLTTTTGAANTSREAILLWTAGGTVTRNITAPAQSKTYIVINASSSTQSIVLRGVGPTTGVTIIKGESAVCAWNGTDFIKVSNISGPGTFTDLTVTGNTSLGDADTDTITQAASYVTGTQLKSAKTAANTLNLAAYDTDGLAYTNLVTLTASTTPTLALTSTGVGTINNMSVGATTASTGAFTTLSNTTTFTRTATTQNWLDGSMTTATWIVGGTTQTGAITLGRSTGAQTLNLATGATLASTTKAINIGTTGVSTSVTNITSGSSVAGALVTHTWNAGANSMTLDSSGNVGIGTSSPATKLEVSGSMTAQNFLISVAAATYGKASDTSIEMATSADATPRILFRVGSASERMRIDSSGNVGIGTSSPSSYSKLAVYGSDGAGFTGITSINSNASNGIAGIQFSSDTTYTKAAIGLLRSATNGVGSLVFYNDSNTDAANWSTGDEKMRINSSGYVGIGNSTVTAKLDVEGAGQANAPTVSGSKAATIYAVATDNTSDIGGGIEFGGVASKTFAAWKSGVTDGANNTLGYLAAYTRNASTDAAMTERMRIDPSGNVGIGGGTPGSNPKLSLYGGIRFLSTEAASATYTGIGSIASDTVSISTSGSERMRVDTVGIVTMSAYGAGTATFSAAGVISSVSDETWKIKDGVPVDVDVMLNKLEPGYWYYNDEKKATFGTDRQLGFYAQNVNAALGPEAAPVPEEGKPWGYYDRSVLAVTVMSLQKALATIESLTARIAALESK